MTISQEGEIPQIIQDGHLPNDAPNLSKIDKIAEHYPNSLKNSQTINGTNAVMLGDNANSTFN